MDAGTIEKGVAAAPGSACPPEGHAVAPHG
jgi:hypothetical protein